MGASTSSFSSSAREELLREVSGEEANDDEIEDTTSSSTFRTFPADNSLDKSSFSDSDSFFVKFRFATAKTADSSSKVESSLIWRIPCSSSLFVSILEQNSNLLLIFTIWPKRRKENTKSLE